jgi:hypothetical protein
VDALVQLVVQFLSHAPGRMIGTRFGAALCAWLSTCRIEYGVKIKVSAARQSARFLESAMSTLLHGPAPTCDYISAANCIAGKDRLGAPR